MLNEIQVQYIQKNIEPLDFKTEELKDEFLDHLCCSVEHQMGQGVAFHAACTDAFMIFEEDEMQRIDLQIFNYLNRKQLIMKKVSILALACMFITTIIWGMQQDPPDRSPLSNSVKITSGFGMRMHPIMKLRRMHRGIDFGAPTGTPIYATSDGIIEKAVLTQENKGYGNHIIIRHDEEYQSLYAQMEELHVKVGQKVKKGDIIGLVGSSGASTAPHLHYEVRKNGKAVNPQPYLNGLEE